MRTRKPTLRYTKYLRRIQTAGPRIPIEAECTACADVQFKIAHDKRREWMNTILGGIGQHTSDLDTCVGILESRFEEHMKTAHSEEHPSKT